MCYGDVVGVVDFVDVVFYIKCCINNIVWYFLEIIRNEIIEDYLFNCCLVGL